MRVWICTGAGFGLWIVFCIRLTHLMHSLHQIHGSIVDAITLFFWLRGRGRSFAGVTCLVCVVCSLLE